MEESLEAESDLLDGGKSPLIESLSQTSMFRRKSRGSSLTASAGFRNDIANSKQDQRKSEEVSFTYVHFVSAIVIYYLPSISVRSKLYFTFV